MSSHPWQRKQKDDVHELLEHQTRNYLQHLRKQTPGIERKTGPFVQEELKQTSPAWLTN
jgi:hypothetical protein